MSDNENSENISTMVDTSIVDTAGEEMEKTVVQDTSKTWEEQYKTWEEQRKMYQTEIDNLRMEMDMITEVNKVLRKTINELECFDILLYLMPRENGLHNCAFNYFCHNLGELRRCRIP